MPNPRPRSLVQVNTTDVGGGAAAIALGLHTVYRERNLDAWMAVGTKRSRDVRVLEIPNDDSRTAWARAWRAGSGILTPLVGRVPGAYRARDAVRTVGAPARAIRRSAGRDDFDYPGTARIPALFPIPPEVIHLHNLHGDYFDLRALPSLSRAFPTLITLHDSWMLGGKPPNPFAKAGTENDEITVSLDVPQDGSAPNWLAKKEIYSQTTLVAVSPSHWLAALAQESILAKAAQKIVVINNGVDQNLFRPADRSSVRGSLGIPDDTFLVLFAANGIRDNGFKDYPTLHTAVQTISRTLGDNRFEFIGVGDSGPAETFRNGKLSFIPHVDRSEIPQYYQAADIYMHAARSDNFPNTIIEALSCGTPVVATAVGGIPEQVRAFGGYPDSDQVSAVSSLDDATGLLVGRGEGEKLGKAAAWLAVNGETRDRLGRNSARDAAMRFNVELQADRYMELYEEMVAAHSSSSRP